MKKEMLINVLQPEECRIAIIEDGVLEELYVERTSLESYTGNIYKGKIVNLEPAIQAAFVDFSVGRNGFLHVSDVEPQYYRRQLGDDLELGGRDKGRDPRHDRGDGPRSAPPLIDEDDRYHDRPDRSEKGRRDRTERRFGEGLIEDEFHAPPQARTPDPEPSEPAPEPRTEAESEPAAHTTPSEPPKQEDELESIGGWRTSRRKEPPRLVVDPIPSGRVMEPQLPRQTPPPADPVEADLPPSRTSRGRAASPPPAVPHPYADLDAESEPAAPESRRGRGRGRGRTEATPAFDEPAANVAPESDLFADVHERSAEERPEPRRRGGRDAIRARAGGESRPPRERRPERSRPPVSEDIRPVEADLPRSSPDDTAPVRERDPDLPERPRRSARPPAERRRPAAAEGESRSKQHGRAGEPGYVPRRERVREIDPRSLDADPPTERDPFDWSSPSRLEDERSIEAPTEISDEAEDELPPSKTDGRRRRRRRGRRRDRGAERPVEAVDEDLIDEIEPLIDEEEPPRRPARDPRRAAKPRPAEAPAPSFDDYDFDEPHDEDDEDDEVLSPREAMAVDEEIDPELEEEIRREVEEIAELEREMGLRGPSEARPRRGDDTEGPSRGGRGGPRGRGLAPKPPIQDIFRRGDEVLVQVIKESIGTKGPTLSTYISIPGRYLVLMPGLNRVGVSRKISDEGQRRRLREIMNALNPPKGLGFIVRTAGLDRTKKELARDLAYLLRLWKVILRRIKKAKAPAPIYQESDMITRTIRDIFNSEIDTIWIDEPHAFERAQEFLRVVMPKFVNRLRFYDERVPLFRKYGIEDEIAKIQRRKIDLPGGGSIVIDPTEALVAIDVNSGNFRVEEDAERTAYEMNLRAAKEIARQLRLRDLGGVICNDFIDMRDERHRRGVERALRDAIKRDRARTKLLRMSQFGIIEMTRQRIRPSLKRSVYEDCNHCLGTGVVKTVESMSIDVMRLLAFACHRQEIRRANVNVCPDVATFLTNRKRHEIAEIERVANLLIYIHPEEGSPREHLHIDCFDAQNNEVRLLPPPPAPPAQRRGR
jgi:ribonuclease E